jgi:hypothetical protein
VDYPINSPLTKLFCRGTGLSGVLLCTRLGAVNLDLKIRLCSMYVVYERFCGDEWAFFFFFFFGLVLGVIRIKNNCVLFCVESSVSGCLGYVV